MKTIILMATMLLTFGFANAQIGEVKIDGAYAQIYDESGEKTGRIFLSDDKTLEGYSSKMVVVKEGAYAQIFDKEGEKTGRIFLGDDRTVSNVTGGQVVIKKGSQTEYYDKYGEKK